MQRQSSVPFAERAVERTAIAVPADRRSTAGSAPLREASAASDSRRRAVAPGAGDRAAAAARPGEDPIHALRQRSTSQWCAEVSVRRADSRDRRLARIDAAARAGVSGVHAAADIAGGSVLCGAGHVELAARAAEHGLLYGVAPRGPRNVSLTEPWADYYLLEVGCDAHCETVGAPDDDLCRELARTGRPIWIRPARDVPRSRIESALHGGIDRLAEHGARRFVVVAPAGEGARAAILGLRRTTGLPVGCSDAIGDADVLERVHDELGVRHFVVRLELEGEGRAGTGFDPLDLRALRVRMETERRSTRAARTREPFRA